VFSQAASTYADALRYYSFRRDKVTGRMAALIWLE
jgi:copper oxidase (laccase) domain-containing protein